MELTKKEKDYLINLIKKDNKDKNLGSYQFVFVNELINKLKY